MEYKLIDKENQSLLKELLVYPGKYLDKKERYKANEKTTDESLLFGNVVDHHLSEDSPVEDSYYIMDAPTISEKMVKIIDHVFEEMDGWKDNLEDCEEAILRACKYENYQSRWKDETRINDVIKQGSDYFKSLLASSGKTIISQELYTRSVNSKDAVLNDLYTGSYFKPNENQQLLKKVVIEFEYLSVELKCELDFVFIDHATKEITPLDLKTMSRPVYTFVYNNFWPYRYDFQAAVYSFACEFKFKELIDKGYKVMPFTFLVVESFLKNKPLRFICSEEVLEIGMNGGSLTNGRVYEGFQQAIDRYIYHSSNNEWDYSMEYIKDGGEYLIEI